MHFMTFLLLASTLALQPALAPQNETPQQTRPAPNREQPPYRPEFVIPQPDGQSPQEPASPPATVNANTYKIGLQDELKITVFDEPDLTSMYRVDADGFITFPLIGRVSATGLALSEL